MFFVAVEGFGAEDAGVASGAVGVAEAEGAEEFGEEFVGSLLLSTRGGDGQLLDACKEEVCGGELCEVKRTNSIPCARCLAALVFLLPNVMSFSATRWASFARGHVVRIDSVSMRDVTRLRRRAERCEDLRPRCRCFIEDIGSWPSYGWR